MTNRRRTWSAIYNSVPSRMQWNRAEATRQPVSGIAIIDNTIFRRKQRCSCFRTITISKKTHIEIFLLSTTPAPAATNRTVPYRTKPNRTCVTSWFLMTSLSRPASINGNRTMPNTLMGQSETTKQANKRPSCHESIFWLYSFFPEGKCGNEPTRPKISPIRPNPNTPFRCAQWEPTLKRSRSANREWGHTPRNKADRQCQIPSRHEAFLFCCVAGAAQLQRIFFFRARSGSDRNNTKRSGSHG